MIACPGSWKNFEQLEDELTLQELQQIIDSFRELERNRFKMQAALQGVDIDKGNSAEDEFLRVKMRAEARARGVSEEEYEFGMIGVAVEEFED